MRSTRLFLVLAALFAGLVVVAGTVLWLALPGFIEREVVRRGREQGVELSFQSLDFGWQWAELHEVKVTLIGVPGLGLEIKKLSAELERTKLTRLDLDGLRAQASGSLPALGLSLAAWSKRYPSAYSLPLSAKNVSVEWRPEAGQPAWLELTGGSIARTTAGTIVAAEQTKVAGTNVGRIGATWVPTATSIALGFGETDLARAPVRVNIDLSSPKPKLGFELAQTSLERLAAPFAVTLPVRGVSASASVGLEFASQAAMNPERGAVRAVLHGYIPPHPAELDGFVFGDTTSMESNLTFSPDGNSVALENTRIVAGKFVLAGGGNLVRNANDASLTLDLRGALPCDALAGVAAESRVGRLLGRPQGSRAGSVARQVIGGSVGVRVQVAASTKNLAAANVKRSIGIGCGLKPLTLADLARLGEELLPSDLSELAEDIQKLTPKLPDGTPLIPSNFPALNLPPLPSGLKFPTLPPFPPLPSAHLVPSAKPATP